jgi:hypothetical protein
VLSNAFQDAITNLYSTVALLFVAWISILTFHFDTVKGFAVNLFSTIQQIANFLMTTSILLLSLFYTVGGLCHFVAGHTSLFHSIFIKIWNIALFLFFYLVYDLLVYGREHLQSSWQSSMLNFFAVQKLTLTNRLCFFKRYRGLI